MNYVQPLNIILTADNYFIFTQCVFKPVYFFTNLIWSTHFTTPCSTYRTLPFLLAFTSRLPLCLTATTKQCAQIDLLQLLQYSCDCRPVCMDLEVVECLLNAVFLLRSAWLIQCVYYINTVNIFILLLAIERVIS